MPHYAASDLSLHCLPIYVPLLGFPSNNWLIPSRIPEKNFYFICKHTSFTMLFDLPTDKIFSHVSAETGLYAAERVCRYGLGHPFPVAGGGGLGTHCVGSDESMWMTEAWTAIFIHTGNCQVSNFSGVGHSESLSRMIFPWGFSQVCGGTTWFALKENGCSFKVHNSVLENNPFSYVAALFPQLADSFLQKWFSYS